MLKPPTIIVLLSVPFFMSVTVCFEVILCWVHRYLQQLCPLLGLSIMLCPSLAPEVSFILVSMLSEMRIATPAFFYFHFCILHPFTFRMYASLGLKWALVDSICVGLVFASTQPICVFWLEHLTHLHLKQLLLYIFLFAFS